MPCSFCAHKPKTSSKDWFSSSLDVHHSEDEESDHEIKDDKKPEQKLKQSIHSTTSSAKLDMQKLERDLARANQLVLPSDKEKVREIGALVIDVKAKIDLIAQIALRLG